MKMVVTAGTPGSGKTSVLMHAIRDLRARWCQAGAGQDRLSLDRGRHEVQKIGCTCSCRFIKDMCPDHYAIYNVEEMLDWAAEQRADVLLNETAGLCLRCAPYPDGCLAVCVIDVTTGPNTPLQSWPSSHHCRCCGHHEG